MMTQKSKDHREGVQVRLDPLLKHAAKIYLAEHGMNWQQFLEQSVMDFVNAKAQMDRTTDSDAFRSQTLIQSIDGLGLLTKFVRIGQFITDAIVIDAHPIVASWYGYEDPRHLRGRYVSQLHDPTCLKNVRQYAVARGLGLPGVPTTYDMRICLPNGQHRWLRKQNVRQIIETGELFWFTECESIPDEEATFPQEFSLPISETNLASLVGLGSLMDVELILEQVYAQSAVTIGPVIEANLQRYQSVELPLHDAGYRRWIHRCCRCEKAWVSGIQTPKKCNRCKSLYWATPRQ